MTASDEKPSEEVKGKRYPEVELKEGENFRVIATIPEVEKRPVLIHVFTRSAKEGRNHRLSIPLRAAKTLLENAQKAVEVEKSEYPKSYGRVFSTFRRSYYMDLRTTEEHGSFLRISSTPKHFSVFIQHEDLQKFVNSFKETIEEVPEQCKSTFEYNFLDHVESAKEATRIGSERDGGLQFAVTKKGDFVKIVQNGNGKGRKRNMMFVPTKQLHRLQEIVSEVIKKTEEMGLKDGGDCKTDEVEAAKVVA